MTDFSDTIIAKSDQLNADDLIGGPITVTLKKPAKVVGDQPMVLHYEGDKGKPFKPCKTMRRAIIMIWGKDGTVWEGRSMTLYRDPDVLWAGKPEGGIRISHMSHITREIVLPLTVTRGKKAPFTVRPLASGGNESAPKPAAAELPALTEEQIKNAKAYAARGSDYLQTWWSDLKHTPGEQHRYKELLPELKRIAEDADAA